jgi:hypothetical protein
LVVWTTLAAWRRFNIEVTRRGANSLIEAAGEAGARIHYAGINE